MVLGASIHAIAQLGIGISIESYPHFVVVRQQRAQRPLGATARRRTNATRNRQRRAQVKKSVRSHYGVHRCSRARSQNANCRVHRQSMSNPMRAREHCRNGGATVKARAIRTGVAETEGPPSAR
jgi:folylpolyglutamate synthase/dihydropteroate synthase